MKGAVVRWLSLRWALAGVRSGSIRLLLSDPWFDGRWYLETYADVGRSGMHPLVHYLRFGASEGRDPSPDFDARRYRERYPDVSTSGMSELEYHVRVGAALGNVVERPLRPRIPDAAPLREWRRRLLRLVARRRRPLGTRQVLVVDWATPTPDRDSGSLSTLNYLRALKQLGYSVTFVPHDLARHEKYARALEEMGVRVWARPLLESPVDALHLGEFDLALLIRPASGATVLPALRARSPRTRIVYAPGDLHHMRLAAQARLTGSTAAAREVERFREIELANVRGADLTVVISDSELTLLRTQLPDAWVEMLPMARDGRPRTASAGHGDEITFLGGFRHEPNEDAVVWFLDEVWPLVESRLPEARFVVYGSDLPQHLSERASARVEMRGYVEDVADAFANARLTVVPLRFGGGIKGKVVSAMHAGVPIVSSSVGVDGMTLHDEVLVADGAQDFANAVIRVFKDTAVAAELSAKALATARERFSAQALTGSLSGLLDRLFARPERQEDMSHG